MRALSGEAVATFRFDEAEFRARAAERLHGAVPAAAGDPRLPAARGDDDLNPHLRLAADAPAPSKPAAVLVALVRWPAGLTVLLTQRTEHLANHPGQVAFPGGRVDAGDRSAVETALREAEEEIGLDPASVEVVGFLDTYETRTGYRVVPVVGLVAPVDAFHPHPHEVADVFEVPLAFLMDPANHRRDSRLWQGVERQFYAMPYGERYIWGATAGILRNLYDRVYAQ